MDFNEIFAVVNAYRVAGMYALRLILSQQANDDTSAVYLQVRITLNYNAGRMYTLESWGSGTLDIEARPITDVTVEQCNTPGALVDSLRALVLAHIVTDLYTVKMSK